MSERLPRVTAADALRALERGGFLFARQSGSHRIVKNAPGKRVTVPFHSGHNPAPQATEESSPGCGVDGA
ncbi:MAG: type II toxin-antitoxin system HicA family toxin [Bryobacteraceae bacterium]